VFRRDRTGEGVRVDGGLRTFGSESSVNLVSKADEMVRRW